MTGGALVLVVEDEAPIAAFLTTLLDAHGYRTVIATSLREGLMEATTRSPDLILLDLGLPDGDGLELVRRLRQWSATPIIVVSARGREADKIEALDAGADDYLTKPFGGGELLARLRVAMRHRPGVPTSALLATGPVVMDLERREVKVDGRAIELTPIEFKLLELFLRHAGRVLTHALILREVWGPGAVRQTHYVRVHVHALRKKIEVDPNQPALLRTESGVGYRFGD